MYKRSKYYIFFAIKDDGTANLSDSSIGYLRELGLDAELKDLEKKLEQLKEGETMKKKILKVCDDVKAVCMSAPGRIDSKRGYFYTSGALKYLNDHCLPEEMKEQIPVPSNGKLRRYI